MAPETVRCEDSGRGCGLTMQQHDADDEPDTQHHHYDGVDLQSGTLVRVEPLAQTTTSAGSTTIDDFFPLLPFFPRLPRVPPSLFLQCLIEWMRPRHTQHSVAAPTRARRTRATRPRIGDLVRSVRRCFAPDRRLRSARWRG